MPASTRLIRRRIKSVGNTKKITKAMEMVSASKMRRAVSAVQGTRPYFRLAWSIVQDIGRNLDTSLHPLLRKSETIKKALVIVIASDRGLAGSYNAQVGRTLAESLRNPKSQLFVSGSRDFVTVGKKAETIVRKFGGEIVATFTNISNNPKSTDIRPLAGLAIGDFISKKYDRVFLVYTDFLGALRQVPRVKQLLPVEREEAFDAAEDRNPQPNDEYLFEPGRKQVLELMLPRIVEAQVFQAILESNASEHSARMLAMRNATDAAEEMIDDLTFAYNQIRQATITWELAEIVSGKAAIE